VEGFPKERRLRLGTAPEPAERRRSPGSPPDARALVREDNVNVSGDRAELQLAKPFGAEMLLLCVNRLVGARSSSGRARVFENLTCRLSKDQSTVSFLLDEADTLPLFCLQTEQFERRTVREISSGFVRASIGTPEPGGIRQLVLSRTWGGAEIFSGRERIRLDGEP